jgi:hypothetical protein
MCVFRCCQVADDLDFPFGLLWRREESSFMSPEWLRGGFGCTSRARVGSTTLCSQSKLSSTQSGLSGGFAGRQDLSLLPASSSSCTYRMPVKLAVASQESTFCYTVPKRRIYRWGDLISTTRTVTQHHHSRTFSGVLALCGEARTLCDPCLSRGALILTTQIICRNPCV